MNTHINKIADIFLSIPKGVLAEILVGGFCLQILALSVPIFLHVIFDKVIVHTSYNTLNVVATGMVLTTFFEGVLLYFFSRHVHYLFAHISTALGAPVMEHLLRLPLQYFDSRPKGEIAKYIRDIGDIRIFFSAASVTALTDAVFIVVILILMAFYSLALSLTVATSIPVLVVFSIFMNPTVKQAHKEQSLQYTKFDALVSEGLGNMQTIKTHAMEKKWLEKWLTAYDHFVTSALDMKLNASYESAILRMIQRIIMLAVLWIGAAQVLSNDLSYGQLIVCYMFALIVLVTSGKIFEMWILFQTVQEARRSLDDLLAVEPEQANPVKTAFMERQSPIVINDIAYQYPGSDADILRNVTIRIEPRSFVGMIGSSGSGKSTLAKLLQRHASPTRGGIFLGDANLEKLDICQLRQHIRLVMQDATLFQDTIANNLRYGAKSATDEEIVAAARLTCAHAFIQDLPNDYDTILDERAARLSSGQRQRIALARAILQRPDILILDEATNALDTTTEKTVLQNLRGEFKDRIFIVITHRPHTLQDADQILIVERGRVQQMVKPYPSEIFFSESSHSLDQKTD